VLTFATCRQVQAALPPLHQHASPHALRSVLMRRSMNRTCIRCTAGAPAAAGKQRQKDQRRWCHSTLISSSSRNTSTAGSADAGPASHKPEAEHECAACGAKREDPGITLQLCSVCHSVRYCSPAWQHWKEHKAACRAVQKSNNQDPTSFSLWL
jgi:hypothetical protein